MSLLVLRLNSAATETELAIKKLRWQSKNKCRLFNDVADLVIIIKKWKKLCEKNEKIRTKSLMKSHIKKQVDTALGDYTIKPSPPPPTPPPRPIHTHMKKQVVPAHSTATTNVKVVSLQQPPQWLSSCLSQWSHETATTDRAPMTQWLPVKSDHSQGVAPINSVLVTPATVVSTPATHAQQGGSRSSTTTRWDHLRGAITKRWLQALPMACRLQPDFFFSLVWQGQREREFWINAKKSTKTRSALKKKKKAHVNNFLKSQHVSKINHQTSAKDGRWHMLKSTGTILEKKKWRDAFEFRAKV